MTDSGQSHKGKHLVIGGGYSGLLTAFRLAEKGYNVEIFEGTQWGGMIQTRRTPFGLVETAANGFLASIQLLSLGQRLGLPFVSPKPSAKARYIYQGQFRRWPLSPMETVNTITSFFRARLLRKDFPPQTGETLADWGKRCFGPAFTDKVLRVAVQGIYASPAESLSARLILGRFFRDDKVNDEVKKPSRRGLLSLGEGMQQLTDTLRRELAKNSSVSLRQQSISAEQVLRWSKDDGVVGIWLATSAPAAAGLTEVAFPELSLSLKHVDMLPVLSLTLFFEKNPNDLSGFGFLNHPQSSPDLLGVLFNTDIFPGRGGQSDNRSETWILAGAGPKNLIDKSEEEILAEVLSLREERLRESKLLHSELTRWPIGLPHYNLKLERIQHHFQKSWGKLQLVGNYVYGIGLTQMTEDIEMKVGRHA